ncbi:MAG: biotin synthase BioB [Lachnotalea sp.]
MLEKQIKQILSGVRLKREDDLSFLLSADLEELCKGSDEIRANFCGNKVNLCTIINGRSGKCSENCKFCAQSGHHHTKVKEYPFLDVELIVNDCKSYCKEGVHRYSIVTAGRTLAGKDLETALAAYTRMHDECDVDLCASHGLLDEETFRLLKESGVSMYHTNIETSRRNFPNICTTHTFDDKIKCIKAAQSVGLNVCSGGIIGMGETWEDRIDMALTLSELNIDSIPLNMLVPIKGTTLGNLGTLFEDDMLRTIAIFRFINPTADIRLAAGRSLMKDCGKKAFYSGANATITGNLLTTTGCNTAQDKMMLLDMGFIIERSYTHE